MPYIVSLTSIFCLLCGLYTVSLLPMGLVNASTLFYELMAYLILVTYCTRLLVNVAKQELRYSYLVNI